MRLLFLLLLTLPAHAMNRITCTDHGAKSLEMVFENSLRALGQVEFDSGAYQVSEPFQRAMATHVGMDYSSYSVKLTAVNGVWTLYELRILNSKPTKVDCAVSTFEEGTHTCRVFNCNSGEREVSFPISVPCPGRPRSCH